MNPVVASGLSVALNGHRVIDSVDLSLEEGRFIALLGPNGSGKTTLVKALLGVIPAVGDLRLFGVPLRAFRAWERIGYVPQRFGAATGVPATVEEVAASGRLAHTGVWRRWKDDDRAALRDALEAAGVQDLARRPVEELSGGQQQRVLIARALASEPELLVLDEPVSSVDLESQQIFAAALGDLKRAGRTVLVVAHALGALQELVDRTVGLEQGRIAYDGPPRLEHARERHEDHHPPSADPGPFDRTLGGP